MVFSFPLRQQLGEPLAALRRGETGGRGHVLCLPPAAREAVVGRVVLALAPRALKRALRADRREVPPGRAAGHAEIRGQLAGGPVVRGQTTEHPEQDVELRPPAPALARPSRDRPGPAAPHGRPASKALIFR